MTILGDLCQQNPGAWIELFSLDPRSGDGLIYNFHAGTNGLRERIVWQGRTYDPWPVQATGFEVSGQQLARPKLSVANIAGAVSFLLRGNDLEGAVVTRRRTLARYLDAVNFPGGNPSADPNSHLPDETWYIAQKLTENPVVVEFELGTPIDLEGVTIPRRQIIANLCGWRYRGDGCGYAGPAVATENDIPTANLAQDKCSKRLSGCRLRFGASADLPYGGFPAAGLVRR